MIKVNNVKLTKYLPVCFCLCLFFSYTMLAQNNKFNGKATAGRNILLEKKDNDKNLNREKDSILVLENSHKLESLLKLNAIYLKLNDINSSKRLLDEIFAITRVNDSIALKRDSSLLLLDQAEKNNSSLLNQTILSINNIVPYFLMIFIFLLAFFILGYLSKFPRYVLGKYSYYKRKWRIEISNDDSPAYISDLVVSKLNDWNDFPQVLVGLLQVKLKIPSRFIFNNLKVEFEEGALPSIQGIELGAIAKTLTLLKKLIHSYCPLIIIKVNHENATSFVNITCKNRNGRTFSVGDKIDISSDFNDNIKEIAFKMYHIISTEDVTPKEIEKLDEFLRGLNYVNEYISGKTTNTNSLSSAHQIFDGLILDVPNFYQAYLIDGVVLDLLEKHNEAISKFIQLQNLLDVSSKENQLLFNQAKYNEAVSRFRTYDKEELLTAESKFDKLYNIKGIDFGLKLEAKLGKANVIAHKLIYCTQILEKKNSVDMNDEDVKNFKNKYESVVKQWFEEVLKLSNEVLKADLSKLDKITSRQINWGINNALGNLYLNFAKYYLNLKSIFLLSEDEAQYQEYLTKSLGYFLKTENYLPKSVESLTNKATVNLLMDHNEECRKLCLEALDINPDYEYAYYRIVESYVREDPQLAIKFVKEKNINKNNLKIVRFRLLLDRLGI